MLKAIFFDAANTLIHLPRSVGEHYSEVAAQFGARIPAADLDHAFRQAWKHSPPRANCDGPRPDDDKGWWRDLVASVLAETLPPEQASHFDASAYFEAIYDRFTAPGVWEVYPDVTDALAGLRVRGLRLGVISNFDKRLYPIFDQLGLTPFFERIIVSSEVGADKPDPRIFQQALAAFGLSAAEALHVGDDPARDWGAETLGLHVFRLERPAMSLRDLLPAIDKNHAERLA